MTLATNNTGISLPGTDGRRQAYFESAVRSLVYHPQVMQQLAAFNATERATARDVLAKMNLPEERRSRLLHALKTP